MVKYFCINSSCLAGKIQIYFYICRPSHLFSWSILPFLHAFYHHIRTMLSHLAYLSDILVHCENQWSIQGICYWLWAMGPCLVWPLDHIRSLEYLMLRLCNLFMSRTVLKYRFNVGLEWKKSCMRPMIRMCVVWFKCYCIGTANIKFPIFYQEGNLVIFIVPESIKSVGCVI